MEIFEMELDKPLEGAMSNDGHLTRPFSDDIDASLDSDRDRSSSSSSPSPRHHKQHTQLHHQHQQLHPHPLHIHPKRHHEHSHPKWDPAFPSPSSSSGSSASSSTASSVSSVSPTSMWEDGSPGQRKASTTIPAGAPRLRPHGQAVAPGLVPSGAGRAGEAAHQQQPLPVAAAKPEHSEHHHHQQPKREGGAAATATAVEERTSGAETREGEEAMETKQPNNSTAAGRGAASNTKYNQMKAKYLRSLNFNEQDVQKRVLNGRHRSLSLPVARPNLVPPPSQALIQQQQSQMGASPPSSSSSSCSSSSSSPLQSPSEGPHPTAIPIPTRRGSQAQAVPPGGLGLSDFSLAPEPGVKLESSSVRSLSPISLSSHTVCPWAPCTLVRIMRRVHSHGLITQFVPPHELVKRDTFSVWQYEKKKNAAYKAL
jgi:hypothetical protein